MTEALSPKTSSEEYREIMARLVKDADYWIEQGDVMLADSVKRRIFALTFGGCTLGEIARLMRAQSQACAEIDAKLGKVFA